jgi:CspA family cold shock protein
MVNRRPPQMSEPYRTGVSALVKWYNPTKGFGFVQPEDGSPDAFLHASLVAQLGHDDLPEGTALVCDIAEGPRGPQVAAIQSVEPPSEPVMRSRPPRRPGGFGGGGGGGYGGGGGGYGGRSGGYGADGAGAGDGEVVEGVVKFFNNEKGFGFIIPDDGGKDVFISSRTLTRAGIDSLEAQQRVRVTTRLGQKGPMAERVELL